MAGVLGHDFLARIQRFWPWCLARARQCGPRRAAGKEGLRGMPLFTNFLAGQSPASSTGTRCSSGYSRCCPGGSRRALPRVEDDWARA